jgi:hypothetical protein
MTTSQTSDLFDEILDGRPIPREKLAYFRARLRLQFHELIVRRFLQNENFTKAELARRIGRAPEVINRLLAEPGNHTLNTLSDLMIGMGRVFSDIEGADDTVGNMLSSGRETTPTGGSGVQEKTHPTRQPTRGRERLEMMTSPASDQTARSTARKAGIASKGGGVR